MAVTLNILRTWREPRRVMRRLLDMGQREDKAIAYLMAGCLLVFIAQMPRLRLMSMTSRATDGSADFDMLMGTTFFVWVLLMPLVFYAIAALSHVIARVLGGQGSWYGARLALFWTLLATAPLLLFYGLLQGFLGAAPITAIVGAGWLIAFGLIWVQTLREAERPANAA